MPWASSEPRKPASSGVTWWGKCVRSRSHSSRSSPGSKGTGKSGGVGIRCAVAVAETVTEGSRSESEGGDRAALQEEEVGAGPRHLEVDRAAGLALERDREGGGGVRLGVVDRRHPREARGHRYLAHAIAVG